MRVCICATQVPFSRGGAELHAEALRRELANRGHEVELVTVPFSWSPRLQLLKSALAWRLLDLRSSTGEPPDLVIATRFPAYLIRHPNKVVWLLHQFRQVYDLLGTPYSDFGSDFGSRGVDRRVVEMVRRMDTRALRESRALFAIARTPAQRLKRFNGLEAQVLYPPSQLSHRCRCDGYGEYVLGVGRLDRLKRWHLLVEAMAHTRSGVRCKIAGTGPEREALADLVASRGVGHKVELLGWVEEEEVLDLYAGCLALFYAPYDEDFGYATVEAFASCKAVVSASDSGGVLELAEDGKTGLVCSPDRVQDFARSLDRLFEDREMAARLGTEGHRRIAEITWERVITRLVGGSS